MTLTLNWRVKHAFCTLSYYSKHFCKVIFLQTAQEIQSRHEIQAQYIWPSSVTLTFNWLRLTMYTAHDLIMLNICTKLFQNSFSCLRDTGWTDRQMDNKAKNNMSPAAMHWGVILYSQIFCAIRLLHLWSSLSKL